MCTVATHRLAEIMPDWRRPARPRCYSLFAGLPASSTRQVSASSELSESVVDFFGATVG